MRNMHGEGRAQAQPRPEAADVMAQCYNCHTMATPLWRKDDEGKTVCNAPGVSRRASPAHDTSPTFAPDSSTSTSPPQLNYQYPDNLDFSSTQSELLGALGQDMSQSQRLQ
ncbi:hypothetical protein VKT23_015231 [Stygiomarasmius scandens]|uniref:GATA-type domain-containing protein n=1 Tax=Marasmiellus scandens TaxID=2682957 RepID=A0ABR1J0X2_9AGAR